EIRQSTTHEVTSVLVDMVFVFKRLVRKRRAAIVETSVGKRGQDRPDRRVVIAFPSCEGVAIISADRRGGHNDRNPALLAEGENATQGGRTDPADAILLQIELRRPG